MLSLNVEEKEKVLSQFPKNIKLSYENMVHKKVLNASLITIIPQGKKCFVWFTMNQNDKPICYFLIQDKRRIAEISIAENVSFDFSLSYGTILYGTMFHYQKQAFFTIEDIFYNQGVPINNESESWSQKLMIIKKILDKKITQNKLQSEKEKTSKNNYIRFGLPFITNNEEELNEKMKTIPYKIYCILFRKKEDKQDKEVVFKMLLPLEKHSLPFNESTNSSNVNVNSNIYLKNVINNTLNRQKQFQNRKEIVFKVRPDIQNDIYHLFCADDNKEEYYYDIAYIPDYKTSIFMNRLFRKIKENENLDTLEESDDEDEFENEKEDQFVYLEREYNMQCNYHYKFKKWVPIKIINSSTIPLVNSKDLHFIQENRKNKH
jgi:hypothetical protein